MKILFFASAKSIHTKKWCRWFTEQGHEVAVLTFHNDAIENTKVFPIKTKLNTDGGDLAKLNYLTHRMEIRNTIRKIQPDIINVHYATSYGAAAAASGLRNYVLSVWGSDIYDFPRKSPVHRQLLEFSLRKAKYLFSTSRAMAKETEKYTKKEIIITPFGVDTALFSPDKRIRHDGRFVIGTVKSLYPKYGIDKILLAASEILRRVPALPLEVRIAGSGPLEAELKELSRRLKLEAHVTWLGYISQEAASLEWANMDCAVIPSELESESFGVSAVEAEASGIPVVISDVPGLQEATEPGVTSLVVDRRNVGKIADAVLDLYYDREKRESMGRAGREFALQRYNLDTCFQIPEHYFQIWAQENNGKYLL